MEQAFYFYYYSIVSGIALVVHLIINWQQLTGRRHGKSYMWVRVIRQFLFCLTLFFASDVAWGILAELKWPVALYVDTVIFFAMMALCVCSWTRFAVCYLAMTGRARTVLMLSVHGILAVTVVALVVNVFTGVFFTVDSQCVYTEGPVRNLALVLLACFNAFGSAVTLFKLRYTRGATRRRNKMVFAFGVSMVVAILLQLGDPFLPIYSLGCLIGCCLLHVFVFEDERDEIHKKEILARGYAAKLEAERTSNKAKSLFFSSVSHDIRTPLNAILGFSELLENGVADEDDRKRYVSSIRASGKVLARLVDDILDLSKLESGKLEIVKEATDVPSLVREVVATFEVTRARKSLILKTEIDEMPVVEIDPQRVRQILYNLVSNAFKFTARGYVSVSARWRSGTLVLSVEDTGEGISADNLPRILQPFVQIVDRNHRNGTGLGLPICNKLATLMGGELTVESKLGEGSTFTITLRDIKTVAMPSAEAQSAGPSATGCVRAPSGGPSASVLVVDDSPVNRAVLKAMLVKCGVTRIVLAENGREALSILKSGAPVDMVLTDLWMPEMDGNALAAAIRADAKFASLPVYLVTADVEARNQPESAAFTGILLKPISLEKLRPLLG